MRDFLRRWNELAPGVRLGFKHQGEGTILGGCLSLLTTLFFTTFISVQLYAWSRNQTYF